MPKCLGGEGTSRCKHPNIIWLYPGEHYTAHKLLAEEHPDCAPILRAWLCICTVGTLGRKKHVKITKEEYVEIKMKTREAFRWYTNDVDEIRGLECPEGWHPGRKKSVIEAVSSFKHKGAPGETNGMYGKKHTAESNWKRYLKCSAYHWYYNDEGEVYSNEDLTLKGYKRGRNTKKHWYHNATE